MSNSNIWGYLSNIKCVFLLGQKYLLIRHTYKWKKLNGWCLIFSTIFGHLVDKKEIGWIHQKKVLGHFYCVPIFQHIFQYLRNFSDVSESFYRNSFFGWNLGFTLPMHYVFSYVEAFIATKMLAILPFQDFNTIKWAKISF